MLSFIEKSGTGIGKSGAGIEKSGTGIEKSGTGIEKSGTGRPRAQRALLSVLAGSLLSTAALAADPQVLVSGDEQALFVSVHTDNGILVGRGSSTDGAGYFRIPLYAAVGPRDSGAVFQPLVAGSGSGSSGDKCTRSPSLLVAGSGSGSSGDSCQPGASLMVAGSGSGSPAEGDNDASTEVAGSGSGSSGDDCQPGATLMVAGSGSGGSGEGCGSNNELMVAGSGSGSSGEACLPGGETNVAGSGSGSSGDSAGCAGRLNAWGVAEIVIDASGAHVVVERIREGRREEFLLAFLPGSESEVAHSLYRGSSKHGFVAMP